MSNTTSDDQHSDAQWTDRRHLHEQPLLVLPDKPSEARVDIVEPTGIEELLADLGLTEIGAGETAEEIIAAMDEEDERERTAEKARLSLLQQTAQGSDAARN